MTSDRANAYGRVIQTIGELGTTKLQPAEIDRVRAAIDTLLFTEDFAVDGAKEALDDALELCDHLVESGRWTEERAARLAADIAETGPVAPSRA